MDFLQALYFTLLLNSHAQTSVASLEMHPPASPHYIQLGEKVQYKMYYGMIPVGKAQTYIYNDFYRVNRRDCYRINIQARTVGAVDWLAQVDDEWGAYLDRSSLLPHSSYRNLSEGGFRKKEWVRYDHRTQMVEVQVLNNGTGKFYDPKYFHVPLNIRDLVSGLMLLRTIPFDTVMPGDTLQADAFFEETLYDFHVIYEGKEILDTDLGRIEAYRLRPIMPDNPVFDGENSVVAWVSADKNQLPLRMKASMFVGSASLDIVLAEGLAFPLGRGAALKKTPEEPSLNESP